MKAKERYFGELVRLDNGKFKVKFVDKLVRINQHKRRWLNINARDFARELNKSELVIN